jgi:hypothetical protein
VTTDTLLTERDRFRELADDPDFDLVVSANRLYLAIAVADPLGAEEGGRWALSSLPTTGSRPRFSTLSMGSQETFAVFKADDDDIVHAQVLVLRTHLGPDFAAPDGVQEFRSPYTSGGPDQIGLYGEWSELRLALADDPRIRAGARAFAERLMERPTSYRRYHDFRLAGRVLGRS